MDQDGSGSIDQDEMFEIMKSLGTHATPAELRAMIKARAAVASPQHHAAYPALILPAPLKLLDTTRITPQTP